MSDLVIILNQRRAIEAFTKGGNLTLGGNFTVAVGPLGRWALVQFTLPPPPLSSSSTAEFTRRGVLEEEKHDFCPTLSYLSCWTGFILFFCFCETQCVDILGVRVTRRPPPRQFNAFPLGFQQYQLCWGSGNTVQTGSKAHHSAATSHDLSVTLFLKSAAIWNER